jgi:prephenate dehydratase
MAVSVAFQGERGAYSEMAALQYFPQGATLVPCKSFADVFSAAEKKKVDFAVIPVENSIEGSVPEVYDLLLKTQLKAVGEVYHRVRHCLIAGKGTKIKDVKRAYSHPQALGQCRLYLQKKGIEPMPTYDTAGSVKMVKEQEREDSAAIASRRAAELYGMEILDEGIEDSKSNYTRFLVLTTSSEGLKYSKQGDEEKEAKAHQLKQRQLQRPRQQEQKQKEQEQYKTSIIFSVKHVPGALFGILGEFAIKNLNLTKIESRPTKETPWEYNFYVDFDGHASDTAVKQVLKAVKEKTAYLKILGSYRKAMF